MAEKTVLLLCHLKDLSTPTFKTADDIKIKHFLMDPLSCEYQTLWWLFSWQIIEMSNKPIEG